MDTKIFINLHVKDLKKSREFFTKLGFRFDEKFSDESAACLVISDHIYSMLITHPRFKNFTPKEISDATKTTEVLNALTLNSREEVDEFMGKVLKAGGTEARPAEDHGFMYGRSFNDPDGHIWEVFWMNPEAAG